MDFPSKNSQKFSRSLLSVIFFTFFFADVHTQSVPVSQSASTIEQDAIRLSKIWKRPEILKSISKFDEAATAWENIGKWERASFCLRESATLSSRVADIDAALKAAERAAKNAIKSDGNNDNAKSLALISRLRRQRGDVRSSSVALEEAMRLIDSISPASSADVYLEGGESAIEYGNLTKAIGFMEKASILSEGIADLNLKAEIQRHYGIVLAAKGDLIKGHSEVNTALEFWNKSKNERGMALAHNALGFIYVISDQKRKARESYSKARSLFPKGVDLVNHALALTGLGSVYHNLQRFDLAKTSYLEAQNLYSETANVNGVSLMLSARSRIAYVQGERDLSKELASKSKTLAISIGNDFIVAIVDETVGRIDLEEGNYNSAIQRFEKARKRYKALGIPITTVVNALGNAFEAKGDYQKAGIFYQDALKTNRKYKDTVQVAENLYNLAKLNINLEKPAKGLEYVEDSILVTESIYYDVDNNGLRRAFLSSTYDRYELYTKLLVKMHRDFPEKGFDVRSLEASEQARSRSMLESLRLTSADFLADADPKTVTERKETGRLLNVKKSELSNILSGNSSTDDLANVNKEIEKLEHKYENETALLKQKSPIYSEIKNPSKFDIKSFRETILDNDTLLLEFFLGKEASFLWLVDTEKVQVFSLPGRGILETKVSRLLHLLTARRQNTKGMSIADAQKRTSNAEAQFLIESHELSNILFGQIAERIGDKRLVIVPDGKLRTFPISALPQPNSADREYHPLLLTNEIVYAPSASMLQILRSTRADAKVPDSNFLVFADPVFSKADSRTVDAAERKADDRSLKHPLTTESLSPKREFERLPGTKNEADSISRTFGKENVRVKSGFDASRQTFLDLNLADYRIIHFATHGFLNESNPELSGIVLSRFDIDGLRQHGLIRLQDIYGLKLYSDLVVLSACDTAMGEDLKGEGLMSLTNGFLQVGSKSVISSRWKIDDFASSKLMKDFYGILASKKVTPSEALREAQIGMFKDPNYRSPFFWSAFAFTGDFQNKIVLTRSFKYQQYGLTLLLGLLGWILFVGASRVMIRKIT